MKFHVFSNEIRTRATAIKNLSINTIPSAVDTVSNYNGGLTAGEVFAFSEAVDTQIAKRIGEIIDATSVMLQDMATTFDEMDQSIKY